MSSPKPAEDEPSTPAPTTAAPKRSNKRKLDDGSPRATPPAAAAAETRVDSSTVAIAPLFQAAPSHFAPGFWTTRSHPWNKGGYRYIACGPFEDAPATSYPIYQTIETSPPGTVKWAWEDRSSYVHISKDGLRVTAEKGFRSARATIPIREGRWYFEVVVERGGGELVPAVGGRTDAAHVRIGLGRRESGVNAPAGIDGFSYALRDKTGDTVHLSKTKRYGDPFGSGDVVGVFVDLPPMREPVPGDTRDPARIVRKRIPIRYRGQLYFESTEVAVSKEMEDLADAASPTKLKAKPVVPTKKAAPGQKVAPPKPVGPPPRPLGRLEGSRVAFFKNGVSQGVAFEDLLDFLPLRPHPKPKNAPRRKAENEEGGNLVRENYHDDATIGYFPFVSVYGGAVVRLNAGPDFAFPPPSDIDSVLSTSSSPDRASERSWRPLSDLLPIYLAEQHRLDLVDAEEARRAYAREEMAHQTRAHAQASQDKKRQKAYAAPAPAMKKNPNASATGRGASAALKPSALVNANAAVGAEMSRSGSRTGTPLAQEWRPELEDHAKEPGDEEDGQPVVNGASDPAFFLPETETEVFLLEDDTSGEPPSGLETPAAAVENGVPGEDDGKAEEGKLDVDGDVKMELALA